jgi:hypothetical protein
MITIAEMDEMREFARFIVRKQRAEFKKMRLGERPTVGTDPPPELPEELPVDDALPPGSI